MKTETEVVKLKRYDENGLSELILNLNESIRDFAEYTVLIAGVWRSACILFGFYNRCRVESSDVVRLYACIAAVDAAEDFVCVSQYHLPLNICDLRQSKANAKHRITTIEHFIRAVYYDNVYLLYSII